MGALFCTSSELVVSFTFSSHLHAREYLLALCHERPDVELRLAARLRGRLQAEDLDGGDHVVELGGVGRDRHGGASAKVLR